MPTDTDAEKRQVVLLDTSTAIALVVEDHEAHAATLAALEDRTLGLAGQSDVRARPVYDASGVKVELIP